MTPEEFAAARDAIIARRGLEGDCRAAVLAFDIANRIDERVRELEKIERIILSRLRTEGRAAA